MEVVKEINERLFSLHRIHRFANFTSYVVHLNCLGLSYHGGQDQPQTTRSAIKRSIGLLDQRSKVQPVSIKRKRSTG